MHETDSKPCTEDLLPGLGGIQGRPEQPLLMGRVLTSAVPRRLKQQHFTQHLKQQHFTHHLTDNGFCFTRQEKHQVKFTHRHNTHTHQHACGYTLTCTF